MSFVMFPNAIFYKHQDNWRTKFLLLRKKQVKLLMECKDMETSLVLMVLEAHRRAGKDIFAISTLAEQSYKKPGNYYYFLPEKQQARAILVDGRDADGRPVKTYIPPEIVLRWDMQSLKCYIKSKDYRMENGVEYGVSTIEFKGSDVDKMVGSSVKGAIFSEFAISNPRVWHYMSPSIRNNNGWAIFISTPRGYNHFYELGQSARKEMEDPNGLAYAETLTINDTYKHNGKHIFTESDIEGLIARGECESWEQAEQEYKCSKDVANAGAWYKAQLRILKQEGRYGDYQYVKGQPIYVSFDLGYSDKEVLWFFQYIGGKFRWLRHYAGNYQDTTHYDNQIKLIMKDHFHESGTKPACIFLPHDAKKTEAISNSSQMDWWMSRGYCVFGVPKISAKKKAIDIVRRQFQNFLFDFATSFGFEQVNRYAKKFNKTTNRYEDTVDESTDSNHYADSLECGTRGMLLRMGIRNETKTAPFRVLEPFKI